MCPQSDPKITEVTKGKTHMDFELYRKIIDEAADHVQISLFGANAIMLDADMRSHTLQ